jgi:hypothetical protein
MASEVTFFPVDNGDTTLIKLADNKSVLIDINLRDLAQDSEDPSCDVIKELRKRLEKDDKRRPYVDAFLLSHADQDHCRGLQKHFHLGPLSDYNYEPPEGEELKIVIREMWSSPMMFRRARKNNPLCEDAKAFNTEARRRVKLFKEKKSAGEGDRILIIGEDENGKTDELESILVKTDEVFNKINGSANEHVSVRVLAPLPPQKESEEEQLSKNHSSVVLQISFNAEGEKDACLFLTGGDAKVYIWGKMWNRKKDKIEDIQYDLLLSPHHCSWHSLSYDSWSKSENPQVKAEAKSALSQCREGALIVSSSKPIKNDKNDPPCWGAKKEYLSILKKEEDRFYCTGEYPSAKNPEPLTFKVSKEGFQPPSKKSASMASIIAGSTRERTGHG